MTAGQWLIAVVQLSESFRSTLNDLARELRASVVEWEPEAGSAVPAGTSVLIVLAGGSESAALDLLGEMPPGAVPIYVVGASLDHRVAAGAVHRGARDYFALPDDLGQWPTDRVAKSLIAIDEPPLQVLAKYIQRQALDQ